MSSTIAISATVYLMAIVISLIVAVLIKGVVVALPLFEGGGGAAAAPTPVPVPAPTAGGVPQEHIAAISAAISAVIGEHHILHIEDRGRGAVWTAEGRMMHHTSHAISRRPRR